MKILLTGKTGQLGFELQRSLAVLGEVVALDRQACDLADPEAVRAAVRAAAPDVIVNPAAWTAVDAAEADAAPAIAVNAVAPGILGEEAAALGALVIHFSTDYVFDGTKAGPYAEADAPCPLGVYGRTKLEGERALAAATARHLILRTSWVVGAYGNNFAKTMLRLGGQREQLKVVADQFGAPTSAALLADLTAQLVARYRQADSADFPFGLYHVASAGETNWCDYARFVIAEASDLGWELKVQPENILPISTAEYPTPARRPANSRLDTTLFRRTFGIHLPEWQGQVRHILQQLNCAN